MSQSNRMHLIWAMSNAVLYDYHLSWLEWVKLSWITQVHVLQSLTDLGMQSDPQLKDVLELLLECAFGKADMDRVPTRRSRIEILVKENAFNPLGGNTQLNRARDETLYVGFQQDIRIQVSLLLKGLYNYTMYSLTFSAHPPGITVGTNPLPLNHKAKWP